PRRRREASRSTAPGSTFHRSFPGSVVPPPRPAARDSRPTARAAFASRSSLSPIRGEGTERGGGPACSGLFAEYAECSKLIAMARRRAPPKRPRLQIDEAELAAFRAGLRRRYTDDEILGELRAAAERLGRSPTMREFAQDPEARLHPQTVIEHFGTWN